MEKGAFTGHFGPMGVGAVFVSTLALHKLPSPKYPPETQQDYLALMLQPIVAFVVLVSIFICMSFYPGHTTFFHRGSADGLSIPFLNLVSTCFRKNSVDMGGDEELELEAQATTDTTAKVESSPSGKSL